MSATTIREARARRKRRIRGRISGTAERPRVSVFRSNRAIYAQLVDDTVATTLVSARSGEVDTSGLKKAEVARKVGELLAQRAKDKGIESVVFDRSGYLYHGRVKALAEGAREGGLAF
jgi:large subunit ribosomal protein L18